jgi:hypothetical protein
MIDFFLSFTSRASIDHQLITARRLFVFAVAGVLLFECGKFGWDACQPKPGPGGQPWIDFDFGNPTKIDGFALWNGGE